MTLRRVPWSGRVAGASGLAAGERGRVAGVPLPAMPPGWRDLKSGVAIHRLLTECNFDSVLDIGSGSGTYAGLFEDAGKT